MVSETLTQTHKNKTTTHVKHVQINIKRLIRNDSYTHTLTLFKEECEKTTKKRLKERDKKAQL